MIQILLRPQWAQRWTRWESKLTIILVSSAMLIFLAPVLMSPSMFIIYSLRYELYRASPFSMNRIGLHPFFMNHVGLYIGLSSFHHHIYDR